jgi:hypothetical protein
MDEYTSRAEGIVKEIEEDRENIRVRSPYLVGTLRVPIAEASSPSD